MPYDNPKQAQAVFLAIKRAKGLAAAKAWAKKHRKDMSKGAKKGPAREASYVPRHKQGKKHFTGHQSPPDFMNGTQA